MGKNEGVLQTADNYYDNPRIGGRCSVCGTTERVFHKGKGKHKNKTYPSPFYFSVFQKVSWFRGDDEYLGKICKNCIKAGKLHLVNKEQPHD